MPGTKGKARESRQKTQPGRDGLPSRRSRFPVPGLGRFAIGGLLVAGLAAAWVFYPETIKDSFAVFLRNVGLAWLPLLLWASAFLVAFRRRPRSLFRWWNRWLGMLLLVGALLGALARTTVTFELLEREWVLNLGGETIGGDIAGPSWVGLLRILGLTVGGAALALPGRSWRASRGVARGVWSGGRWTARAYRRVPLHHLVAGGFVLIVRLLARGTVGGLRALRWRRQPRRAAGEEPRDTPGQGIPASAAPATQERARPQPAKTATMGAAPGANGAEANIEDEPEPVAVGEGFRGLPGLDFLQRSVETQVPEEITRSQAEHIEDALAQYDIEVKVADVRPGPTVTLYGLVPGWVRRPNGKGGQEQRRRVTVDAILAREKDLALALAAPSIRFEAPIPGESVVGVEVPNPVPSLVTLGSLIDTTEFQELRGRAMLPVGLGRGSGGEVVAADLAQMPHLLVAGATGSGKSVMVHALLASLLLHFSPWELRLVLIDPKRVELTHYNGIPHLATRVVVEADRAVRVLRGVVLEMTHRLRVLEEQGCRNIGVYNERMERPLDRLPYLVVVIDEMADLMMVAPNEIEHALCRLAQLGRATGIHLVVATQRPSVDVVTGLIKANFPSRISFAVTSNTDSRTILDTPGAEKLLGRGDMLFLPQELPKPKRVQGAFISDGELRYLVDFWRNHMGPPPPPMALEPVASGEELEAVAREGRDELLEKARELAQRYSRVSTSLLQRRLRIGYPRAARLREEMESEGIISSEGEVLLPRTEDVP